MGALPKPDVPPGAQRDLLDALHDLHHRAGWPSLRTLARQAGCSHTTVSAVFSAPRLPSWGTLELLVEAMQGDTDHFNRLWLAASTPDGHRPTSPARIAGRRDELTAVRRHLETGTGLLLVTGEAGIGKTTLVATASDLAPDTFVAVGRCLPLSRQVPMLPMADVLHQVLESDGGRRFRAALSSCPAYVATTLVTLLPEIEATPDGDLPAEWARQRLLNAVRCLLLELGAEGPLAIVIEDLHWADASTLELVDYLLRRETPLSMTATWRSDDDSVDRANREWFGRTRLLPGMRALELASLTRDETAEQLALIQGMSPSSSVVDRMHSRTRGHPLFTQQLAAADPGDKSIPPRLAGLLDARLGALFGEDWLVARTLGIADRPLDVSLLCTSTGLERDTVTSSLRALATRRLLATGPGMTAASLAHPLLADAVRRRLVPGESEDAHRRLASALGEREGAEAAEVAVHWQAAGDTREELAWLVRAAKQAASRMAFPQEAEHWLRILDVMPDHDAETPVTRPAAVVAAAEALERCGAEDAALELLEEALSGGAAGTAYERFDLMAQAAAYLWGQRGPTAALDMLDRAVAQLGSDPPPGMVARTLPMRANLLAAAGRFDEAVHHLDVAIQAGRTADDRDLLADALACKVWHVGVAGDLESSLECVAETRRARSDSWPPNREVRLAMMHTDVLLIHARPATEVEAAGARALALIREHDLQHTQGTLVRANVAQALLEAGEVRRAAALVSHAAEELPYSAWPLDLLAAQVQLLDGLLEESLGTLDRPRQHDALADFSFAVPAAEAWIWLGDPGRAFERLRPSLEELGTGQVGRFAARPFVVAARAVADLVENDPGRRDARTWLATLRALRRDAAVDPLGPGPVPGIRPAATATWHAELGRVDGSATVAHWTRAASEWDKLSRRHDAAYCRWRAAQVAIATGQAALATKLLRRAARDAREHVPLLDAVRSTPAPTRAR